MLINQSYINELFFYFFHYLVKLSTILGRNRLIFVVSRPIFDAPRPVFVAPHTVFFARHPIYNGSRWTYF